MKLLGVAAIDGSEKFKLVVEADASELVGLLPRVLVGEGLLAPSEAGPKPEPKRAKKAPAAEPEKPAEAKPAEAPKQAPAAAEPAKANGAPAVAQKAAPANGDGNEAWGIDAEESMDAEPAGDVPAELASAKVLSEIVRYFMAQGVTTKAEMLARCTTWKAKGGDKIPVFARIDNLGERIERFGASMGLT